MTSAATAAARAALPVLPIFPRCSLRWGQPLAEKGAGVELLVRSVPLQQERPYTGVGGVRLHNEQPAGERMEAAASASSDHWKDFRLEVRRVRGTTALV